jgi:DNA-binding SARP family transcriptional activator/tetratricopeptide (TPR) repeat protein
MAQTPSDDPKVPPTLLRISTLGPFSIEYRDPHTRVFMPLPKEKWHGKGSLPALSLLKLLISQSHRYAPQDWILEQFWPDTEVVKAESRLHDASYFLRSLLHPFTSEQDPFFWYVRHTKTGGGGYRLAEYPLIWIDADAFAYYMGAAALHERMGDDPFPFLEKAYHLGARGTFLVEEVYSEWAQARRQELDGAFRLCVHRLGRHYLERRDFIQAEYFVRSYWVNHMTDEDALRLLMDILGEQGRYQEVNDCYRQTRELREQAGEALDPRTHDLAEYWRTKPMSRPAKPSPQPALVSPAQSSLSTGPSHIIIVSSNEDDIRRIIKGETNAEDFLKRPTVMDSAGESSDTVSLLKAGSLVCQAQLTICQQQQKYIQDQIQRGNTMGGDANQLTDTNQITRRHLIEMAFVAAPLLTNVQRERPRPFMVEEFLSEATTSITACWHLLRGDGLTVVERAVPQYLSVLEGLVKHSSLYRQRASYLAAQGFLLLSLVTYHRLHLADYVMYRQQAVKYAREAGDLTLLVTSIRDLGKAFLYNGQRTDALETSLEAERYSQSTEIARFLRSSVLSELGRPYAQQGKSEEVVQYMDEARTLPTDADDTTPVFLSTDYGLDRIILREGLSNLDLGDYEREGGNASDAHKYYKKAAKKLAQIEQLPPNVIVPERIRIEIETNWALAEARAGNRDGFIIHFKNGFRGAKLLGSAKREQEAIESLIVALELWSHEKLVTNLLSSLRESGSV